MFLQSFTNSLITLKVKCFPSLVDWNSSEAFCFPSDLNSILAEIRDKESPVQSYTYYKPFRRHVPKLIAGVDKAGIYLKSHIMPLFQYACPNVTFDHVVMAFFIRKVEAPRADKEPTEIQSKIRVFAIIETVHQVYHVKDESDFLLPSILLCK